MVGMRAISRHRGWSRAKSRGRGMSLLEVLVALTLMAFAMLFTMALMAQEPGIERRLDAHREAVRTMETLLETLRSSGVVPAEGELDLSGIARPSRAAAEDLRIWIEVEARPERQLRHVTLRARYSAVGGAWERTLETMFFTP